MNSHILLSLYLSLLPVLFSSHLSKQSPVHKQNDATQDEQCKEAQMQCHTPPRGPVQGRIAEAIAVPAVRAIRGISTGVALEMMAPKWNYLYTSKVQARQNWPDCTCSVLPHTPKHILEFGREERMNIVWHFPFKSKQASHATNQEWQQPRSQAAPHPPTRIPTNVDIAAHHSSFVCVVVVVVVLRQWLLLAAIFACSCSMWAKRTSECRHWWSAECRRRSNTPECSVQLGIDMDWRGRHLWGNEANQPTTNKSMNLHK